MSERQLVDMILQTKEWYDSKVEQLEQVANSEKDINIMFEGKEGKHAPLPKEQNEPFKMGVKVALEIFGKFPINIQNNTND